ncbi:MAG: hypothetical protein HC933_05150, partial [Pleurocapsa sp. SU_196_0]|nr:hypothetical protein [Pleurocapsa sp. SU_196_0]
PFPAEQRRKPRLSLETMPAHVKRLEIVGIAASTGGPQLLASLLRQLPAQYPLPVLVVQHIASGFAGSLVEWLEPLCQVPVRLAEPGVALQARRVGGARQAPRGARRQTRRQSRAARQRSQPQRYGVVQFPGRHVPLEQPRHHPDRYGRGWGAGVESDARRGRSDDSAGRGEQRDSRYARCCHRYWRCRFHPIAGGHRQSHD